MSIPVSFALGTGVSVSLDYGRHFHGAEKISESNLANVFFFSCTVKCKNVSTND